MSFLTSSLRQLKWQNTSSYEFLKERQAEGRFQSTDRRESWPVTINIHFSENSPNCDNLPCVYLLASRVSYLLWASDWRRAASNFLSKVSQQTGFLISFSTTTVHWRVVTKLPADRIIPNTTSHAHHIKFTFHLHLRSRHPLENNEILHPFIHPPRLCDDSSPSSEKDASC